MSERTLTDEDIRIIVETIGLHKCRFSHVEEVDLIAAVRFYQEFDVEGHKEAVKFYRNFNKISSESGKTVRNAIIILGIGGFVTVLGLGIMAQIKKFLGP